MIGDDSKKNQSGRVQRGRDTEKEGDNYERNVHVIRKREKNGTTREGRAVNAEREEKLPV